MEKQNEKHVRISSWLRANQFEIMQAVLQLAIGAREAEEAVEVRLVEAELLQRDPVASRKRRR